MILLTCRHRPRQPDHIYPGEPGTQIRDDVVNLAGARNKNKCRPFSVAIKRVNGHSAKMAEKFATHSPRFHSSTSCRCPLHLEFMQSGGHLDNRRRLNTAEKSCPPGTIDSRRHRDNGQIIAQLSNFTHHCHDEVSVEVTFVDLIEDDGIHPRSEEHTSELQSPDHL